MEMGLALLVVGCSSVGAYLLGVKTGAIRGGRWREALGRLFACLGLAICFFVLNLALGVAGILAFRGIFHSFLPVYLVDDVSLVILSSVQGILAGLLWEAGRLGGGAQDAADTRCGGV